MPTAGTTIARQPTAGAICYLEEMSHDESPVEEEQPIRAVVVDPRDVSAPSAPKAPRCDERPPPVTRVVSRPSVVRFEETSAEQHRRMVGAEHANPRRRRVLLPLVLFLVTCASTFWAGCMPDRPDLLMGGMVAGVRVGDVVRSAIVANWKQGLIYMTCVLAILLTHEMGHFLMTLRYRIAASLPYFIPVPVTPIGTMGAVISMDGLSANRRQIFDIGIAGPLAGLVVALPIMWIGTKQVNLENYDARRAKAEGRFEYNLPLIAQWMMQTTQPEHHRDVGAIANLPSHRLNPFFMAGWVGLLITGLNMMPISQLDGGHVIYALFGKSAHAIARLFLFSAILFVVAYFERAYIWMPMIVLVTLIGTDHPPTADDDAPLGPLRTAIGWASLVIPVFCFPLFALSQL
jgi:Zn-dependent protease